MSSSAAANDQPNRAPSAQPSSVEETALFDQAHTPADRGVASTSPNQGVLPSQPAMNPPERIGRYRVVRLLGQGTFGRVWLAMDDELRRQVAIKVLFSARLAESAHLEAWLGEARALAALDHPHIVPIYDVGRTEDGSAYAVAKFIPGKTLAQEVQDRAITIGGHSESDQGMEPLRSEASLCDGHTGVVSIIARLAEALQHAHERNLIHRDVKPANVLIEQATGRVYLADFGLATRPGHEGEGFVAGTPAYMSPEQARGEPLEARSDLFSLGIIFYELLAGQRPFRGRNLNELLQNVGRGVFTPLEEVAEHLPAELVRICHRALCHDLTGRYASGQDLATDLRAWEQEELRKARGQGVPTNLPANLGELVGRQEELEQVRKHLELTRLLTLTGPGGIGKTRLALQAAFDVRSRFPDGVFVVELAHLTDPVLVSASIAQSVGYRTSGQRPVLDELLEWLSSRKILLVLDNFEHLPTAGDQLAKLLAGAPGLRVLATSRAPLRIAGEQEFPVSLLTLPDPKQLPSLEQLTRYSAIALFVQKAREVLPSFQLTNDQVAPIVEICSRLDGLPLAIELAAARIKLLAPQELLTRLQTNLQLLSTRRSDAPLRQQTLRQAIAWSYELLTPPQQRLFRQLAIFSGGFTLEGAEQVIGPDALDITEDIALLADNSLLRVSRSASGGRISMLETVRQYARELLEVSGEAAGLGRRHAAWLVQLVELAETELRGPRAGEFTQRLEQEHANIRSALAWCLSAPSDNAAGELGLRLAGALWRFWCSCGHIREGQGWLSRLLTAFGDAHQDSIGAKARYAAGCLAEDLGEFAQARQHYSDALRLWENSGEKRHLPDAYIALGSICSSQGDYLAAADWFEKALALSRQLGERRIISVALSNLGSVAWSLGNYEQAKGFQLEALDIRRQLGNRAGVAVSLTSLGLIASRQGDLQGAKVLYMESLAILRELDNQSGISVCLNNLGEIAYRLGECEWGESLLWEALRIQHETGDRLSLAYTLESIAAAAQQQGSSEAAVRFFCAAEALRESLGAPLPPPEKASNDQILQEVRIALGPERFAALWTAAKGMPLEELIEAESRAKTT